MPGAPARGREAGGRAVLRAGAREVGAQEHERRRLPAPPDPDLARGAQHAPVFPADAPRPGTKHAGCRACLYRYALRKSGAC